MTIIVSNATDEVYDGEVVTGWMIDGGGTVDVYLGGVAIDFVVSSGGDDVIFSGGSATGTTISNGGQETLEWLGSASGSIVSSGGKQVVEAGGAALGTTVDYGGQMSVSASGFASGTVINSSGHMYIYDSGRASATMINSGGYEIVSAGGVALYTTVGSGGRDYIYASGVAEGATVNTKGTQYVSSGALALGTTLNSGGYQYVESDGVASANTINHGSLQQIDADGLADGSVVSGDQFINAGGVASGTFVRNGGLQIDNGGMVKDTEVTSSGIQEIYSGASTSTTVLSGGQEDVRVGGTASSTTLGALGSLFIFSAGLASGTNVGSGGAVDIGGSGQSIETVVGNGGAELVNDGGMASGTTVEAGGDQTVNAGGVASGTLVESGGTETIRAGGVAARVEVASGGEIDVLSVLYSAGKDTANLNSATDVLTLNETNGTDAVDFSIQLAGSYAGDYFHVSVDSRGYTLVTENTTPCYCRGTRIATDRGEVAVEDLRIGDRLATLDDGARPIRWIGRRKFAGWQAAGNPDIQPIRFARGSLGDHVPARDLLVSPEHAMFLDGVLIPARHLVNGRSITPAEAMEEVEYFHLELDRHSVIFAEGAASESFVDDGGRGMFNNAYEYRKLYPDAPRHVAPDYCAPRVEDGHELDRVRRRLAGRAARLTPEGTARPAPALNGHLDTVTRTLIEGWAFEPGDPGARVALTVLANGAAIGRVTADRHRRDLEAAGIGDGAHAFQFRIPNGFAAGRAHHIELRRDSDWTPLPGSRTFVEVTAERSPARAPNAVDRPRFQDSVCSPLIQSR